MTTDMQDVGELIDRLDNLIGALQLPMPDKFHVERLKEALPELSADLKTWYEQSTGENPWSENYEH